MAKRNGKKSNGGTPVDVLTAFVATLRDVTVDNAIAFVTATIRGNTAVRNIGRITGTRVMAFQNMTLIRNAEWQLDDCQLAVLWACEFPRNVGRVFAMNGIERPADASSVAAGISIVRGVRAEYNRNGHGEPTGKPAVESVAYGAKRFTVPAVSVTVESAAPAKTKRVRKTA